LKSFFLFPWHSNSKGQVIGGVVRSEEAVFFIAALTMLLAFLLIVTIPKVSLEPGEE